MLANDRKTTDRIFEIVKNLKEQKGGYLKIVNLPLRGGDSAPMVKIEWSKKIEEPNKGIASKKGSKSIKGSENKNIINKTQTKISKKSAKSIKKSA
jgi:hypothetical protein